jgi:non-ribosomal peptide synthetase component E (peptide arylation enzyme)
MLGDALTEAARRGGDAPFILHGDDATSYRQLDATSRRVASSLLRLGIEADDRIGLLSLNRIEWLVMFFAAVRIGATVVAMGLRYCENELRYMVRGCGMKAVALIPEFEGYDFTEMFERLSTQVSSLRHLIVFPSATHNSDAAKPCTSPATACGESALTGGLWMRSRPMRPRRSKVTGFVIGLDFQ